MGGVGPTSKSKRSITGAGFGGGATGAVTAAAGAGAAAAAAAAGGVAGRFCCDGVGGGVASFGARGRGVAASGVPEGVEVRRSPILREIARGPSTSLRSRMGGMPRDTSPWGGEGGADQGRRGAVQRRTGMSGCHGSQLPRPRQQLQLRNCSEPRATPATSQTNQTNHSPRVPGCASQAQRSAAQRCLVRSPPSPPPRTTRAATARAPARRKSACPQIPSGSRS